MAKTPTSSGHVRKKAYQPSINSYFSTRDTSLNNTFLPSQKTSSPLSPPLPPETQASLLSVGMRVRKSVPEGYKTHKTLGSQGFPFPSTALPASTVPVRKSYINASSRELTPFCGLHKTGGWAAQEVPASSAPAAMETYEDDEDDMPSMTMSQSTLHSTYDSWISPSSAQTTGSKKRSYEEETEDDLDAYFNELEETEVEVPQVHSTVRPIMTMKTSKMAARNSGMVHVFGADDFDEAAFLAPLEGMDVDAT